MFFQCSNVLPVFSNVLPVTVKVSAMCQKVYYCMSYNFGLDSGRATWSWDHVVTVVQITPFATRWFTNEYWCGRIILMLVDISKEYPGRIKEVFSMNEATPSG